MSIALARSLGSSGMWLDGVWNDPRYNQVALLRSLPLPRPRRAHPRPPARPRRAAGRPPQAAAGGASRPDPHPDVQRPREAPGRRAHRGPGPRDLRPGPRRHPPPAPRRDRRRDRPRLRLAGRPRRRRILHRLVALNRERAAEEARGLVRWLRPDSRTPPAAPPPPPPRPSSTSARPSPPPARSPPGPASSPSRWPPCARRCATPARPPLPTSPAASAAPAPSSVAPLLETLAALGHARPPPAAATPPEPARTLTFVRGRKARTLSSIIMHLLEVRTVRTPARLTRSSARSPAAARPRALPDRRGRAAAGERQLGEAVH